jgi:type I restriction enzyme S subunit
MAFYRLEVSSFAFPVKPLKRLILGKPQYGANERGVDRVSIAIPRYVRITDIDEYGRLRDGLGVAAENVEEQYLLNDGDLLFARSGNTVGKVYLHRPKVGESFLFAGYMIRLRADKTQVMPEYIFLCTQLEFYKHWIAATQRATGQPNINAEEYRSLEIPVPDLFMQASLVQRYKSAIHSYESSAAKALDLLVGIDDYLLAELGITLPPEPKNTLASRIFTAQRRELAGWRFDPLFHSFKLWHAIEAAHVPHKKLGLCCHYLKSGFAAGGDMQLFDAGGVIQLRPTNIDANREWTFEKNIYLSEATLIDRPDDIIQPGEVLFNNTNSQELVGKTVYMGITGQPFFCSNHMTRIQTINEELNPEYLAALLNAYQRLKVFFSLCTNWNNQSGVNVDLLRQLPIPIPSLSKQAAIADHISEIRQEAKRLRQQAQTELESAKRRIEAMLLGEAT